ncbi:Arylsulfatase [Sedimentisphaera salicampi]|uniref:Arylsulfatase n=2 Tax=Sedimentisphaera salicampi TaxID=1941349 RepID=A0A1W6LKW5_9BACT|nr:Arylsulfatase [Sedimentisphaera salicampi]
MTLTRRNFLKSAGFGMAAFSGSSLNKSSIAAAKDERKVKKPNLVFVMSDEHRKQAMGFMNEDPVYTPNFDKFAEKSMVFTNALCSFPICSPSRGTMWTGMYNISNGVMQNKHVWFDNVPTIFESLKNAGYNTAYVGKWHLDSHHKEHDSEISHGEYNKRRVASDHNNIVYYLREYCPRSRRPYIDFWHANECYNYLFNLCYYEDDPNEPVLGKRWQPEHETDVAIDYIKKQTKKNEPFALFLSYNPPHFGREQYPTGKDIPVEKSSWGFFAPEEYEKLYADMETTKRPNFERKHRNGKADNKNIIKGYFGAVTSIDHNFGRLMNYLEEMKLAEDTIVVYTSDHGDMVGSHGRWKKRTWYEESIGIPMMVSWPHKVKARNNNMLFNNVNLMPTLLGLMDIPVPDRVQGKDFSSVLKGGRVERPESTFVIYDYLLQRDKPSDNEYKLAEKHNIFSASGVWRCLRTERYSYVVQMIGNKYKLHLYDLEKDPYQMNPLEQKENEALFSKLDTLLLDWLKKTEDPFFKWYSEKTIPLKWS